MKYNIILLQVGNNIRSIRKEKGFSQEELAFESGLDRSYVGRVERGERNMSIINLCKFAVALNVDPAILLYNTDLSELKR